MEQRHGHYDEGIGRPNTSAFSRPLEEHFIEPGTDTPGPPAIPSAFVPVANRNTQNRMPLVVPQPRQTNQDNVLPQHTGPGESRSTYRHQNQYQESREPSRQHGTQRHHNATPIITTNNDSNLMPPPSNPQGSVVVNDRRPDHTTPIDTLSTHTRSTHSTMNSIDPEFNGTPIPDVMRSEPRRYQPPRPTNDDMFQHQRHDQQPRSDRDQSRLIEPHRIEPHRIEPHRIEPHRIEPHRIEPHRMEQQHRSVSPTRSPHGRHTTPERQVAASSSLGLQHPEGRVQYTSSAFQSDSRISSPVHRSVSEAVSHHPAPSSRPVIPLRPRRLEMTRGDADAPLGHSLGPSMMVHSRLDGGRGGGGHGGGGQGSDDGRYELDHHHHHHHHHAHGAHRLSSGGSDVAMHQAHHPHHHQSHHPSDTMRGDMRGDIAVIDRGESLEIVGGGAGGGGGRGGGSVPMEMDPPPAYHSVAHHTSPTSNLPFSTSEYQSATSSHQHVPNRTVHSVASQNPTRPSQYSQNPRFRASHSNAPQLQHQPTRDHHQPHLNATAPLAAATTASTRVIAYDVPGRPQYDRYLIQEPQSTVVQPQVAISPTHHHTYPQAPPPQAQLAPTSHVSPVQHSHSPTVQMVEPIPSRIHPQPQRIHHTTGAGYVATYPTQQPPPPTQTQPTAHYTIAHGGYSAPPQHPQYQHGAVPAGAAYHHPAPAPPPQQPRPQQYHPAMVTTTSPHPPQHRSHPQDYRESPPMEYTTHQAARPRSRSPSPYHRRSRSNEIPTRMESDPRDTLGNRELRRDRRDDNRDHNRSRERDQSHDRCHSVDRQRRRDPPHACCAVGGAGGGSTSGTPAAVQNTAGNGGGSNNSAPPVGIPPSEPMQQGTINNGQLVPAVNQGQLHNQSNQLALQQNRSTSDLIQMSNLSTQIQMNGINHTLGAMLVPILKDQGVQQGHREMQQSYQVQNDIRDLRTQFSDMASKYESMLCQQRDDIKTQMKELLENQKNQMKIEKAPSVSGSTSERSGPSRRPDLIRTPDSSSNSQYSDVDCSPHSAGRRPHRFLQRRHEPYSTTGRNEYGSSENSPQSPQVHQRRLQRNISGNSGGYSSAQSSPIDSAMEDHSFQPNSISPTNNQFSDLTIDQVCAKLQEWQVTSDIIQNFRREKIIGRHLNYLNEFMIKKGIMSPATETENPRSIRPLAERLGPLKTVCRALKMNVGQAKVLPTTESHDVMTMNTPDDVVLWLRSIGLTEYSRNFGDEQVNGANLLELCEIDLIQLGMDKLGDRLTFMLEREMLN